MSDDQGAHQKHLPGALLPVVAVAAGFVLAALFLLLSGRAAGATELPASTDQIGQTLVSATQSLSPVTTAVSPTTTGLGSAVSGLPAGAVVPAPPPLDPQLTSNPVSSSSIFGSLGG